MSVFITLMMYSFPCPPENSWTMASVSPIGANAFLMSGIVTTLANFTWMRCPPLKSMP